MTQVPFVDLQIQHRNLDGPLTDAIRRVLDRSWFILGREVEAFEQEFADYLGVSHCIGVGSGTDALHLALKALDIGPGDEVVTVSHTFIATALAITWTGATPVFVDIDPESYTINPERVAEAITPKTRAIIPVHLYGQCADMDPIMDLAGENNLWVVEDAAQAHGSTYKGRKAGAMGHIGCFSFYPSKNLGANGDAGAIVTSDERIARRLAFLRNYGQTQKYHHASFGYNSRLDELQAAILRVKLPHLDDWNNSRRSIASRYNQLLDGKVIIPSERSQNQHVYHLYVIRVPRRDELQQQLAGLGVGSQVHYPIPVHLQEAYIKGSFRLGTGLTITQKVAREVLSLPMYPEIDDLQIDYVAETLQGLLDG